MFDQAGLEVSAIYSDILLPPVPYGPDWHREMVVVGKRAKEKA